jgi:ribonuclease HI
MKYAARLEFQCTNNIAEYEAILLGLRKAKAMGIQRLIIKTDSQIVAGHIKKDYKARDLELARYLQFFKDQEKHFEGFTVKNISRNDNSNAQDVFYQNTQVTSRCFPSRCFLSKTSQRPRMQHKIQASLKMFSIKS